MFASHHTLICFVVAMAITFRHSKLVFKASNLWSKQKAIFINTRWCATMSDLLNKVSDVDISGSGRFKYILINLHDKVNDASKKIVRGYDTAPYHADIFEEVAEKIKEYSGLEIKCLGGGRIEHDPDKKSIKVYGYSQGFGKADHEASVNLLKKKYTDYTIIWSDDGY